MSPTLETAAWTAELERPRYRHLEGAAAATLSYAATDKLQFVVGAQIYYEPNVAFFAGFDRPSNGMLKPCGALDV